jgi:hypothetical protein
MAHRTLIPLIALLMLILLIALLMLMIPIKVRGQSTGMTLQLTFSETRVIRTRVRLATDAMSIRTRQATNVRSGPGYIYREDCREDDRAF